jgi:hypothetical protein
VLALLSAHWPNFWDVLVKVMFGVMVLLMMACRHNHQNQVNGRIHTVLCIVFSII